MFGCSTGEGAELGDRVWLVGVAAGERDPSPAHRAGEAACVLEAK
jgi:hypothetical protein